MAKVLVIDDDSHFRGVIERIILRSYTYSVITAATEEEAWEELSKNSYDLVLLDLYIHGKKSWDTLRRIQALPFPPAVIVISCEDLKETAEYAKALGAADFVAKPIDFGRLKLSVDAALDWKKAAATSRRTGDEANVQEPPEEVRLLLVPGKGSRTDPLPAFDLPGIHVFRAEDPSTAAETARRKKTDAVLADMAEGVGPVSDLLRIIRESEGGALRMPVIALTSSDPETILAALKAGADDYLSVPFDARMLAGKVAAHVRLRREYERIVGETTVLAVKDPFTGVYTGDFFRVRLGEEIGRSTRHRRDMALAVVGWKAAEEGGVPAVPAERDGILVEVSRVLCSALRGSDVVGRLGKNGFAILLPEANAERIVPRMEEVRFKVEERLADLNKENDILACCVGLSSFPPLSSGAGQTVHSLSGEDLLGMADSALARARSSIAEKIAVYGK